MAIVKVSQLAKEMGLHTDAAISMLHKLGHVEIKAHNSTIDDSVKHQILEKMKEGAEMAKQRFANFESRSEKRKAFIPPAPTGAKPGLTGKAPKQNQAAEGSDSRPPRQQESTENRAMKLFQGGGFGNEHNRDRNRNRGGGGGGGRRDQNSENRGERKDFGEKRNFGDRSDRGEKRDFGNQKPYSGDRQNSGGGQGENRDGNRGPRGHFGDRPYQPRGDRPFGGGHGGQRDGQGHGGHRDGGGHGGQRDGGGHGAHRDGGGQGGQREFRGGGGDFRNRNAGDRPFQPRGERGDRPFGDRPFGDRQGGHGGAPRDGNAQSSGVIDAALAKELADKQALMQKNEDGGSRKKKGSNKKSSSKDKFEKRKEQEIEMKANVRKITDKISGGNKGRKKYKKERSDDDEFEEESNIIQVSEFISVGDFAKMVDEEPPVVISVCIEKLGLFVTINQRIDFATIQLLAEEFGFEAQLMEEFEEQESEESEDNQYEQLPRPPVVTIMGHVDHGKTSLLDYIRRTNIMQGEAGGITQHIAAYSVKTKQGSVTFLDTPGHEAFAAMRARGSQITDVVVLVVAADSSVMPQTKEAIDHAKAAGVPIVVAINKIDLPTANPDKIKGELASYGVLVESYGGQVQSVEISAKKGIGVDDLLELLALETGMLDLKASIEGNAKGVVIESELDKGKGALATVLIQSGTLKKGDVFYTGIHSGKVREMLNEQGQKVKEVKPGFPAIILGLSGTPQAGDNFRVCKTEKEAREIAAKRRLAEKERELRNMQNVVSLANLSQKIKDGKMLALNLIVRGDVDGSVEVVAGELQKLSTDEIKVNILLKGVGGIKETDIMLARASDAVIVGFNINPNPKIKASADNSGVEIKTFRVIYELIDQIRSAMIGMLAPDIKEEVIGQVEIREVFKIPKIGLVAGCYVLEGKVERNAFARLIRDDIEIAETKIDTLQRFKDQVKDVAAGFDCGLTLTKVSDYRIGDRVEVYKNIEIKRKALER